MIRNSADSAPQSLRKKVNEVWSQDAGQRAEEQGWYWMAHPMVVARVNKLISGEPYCDAYGRLERLYRERGLTLPICEAVSLGCGFGNLERDLRRRGLVERIAAYDLAEGAVTRARQLADAAEMSGITYAVADLNTLQLEPGSVDAVFAHSAVHHVQDLEHLYANVHAALRPGGVFHLHEFVGPTRFQWTDAQLRLVNEWMDGLPPRLRRLPSDMPKGVVRRPKVEDMIAADPTEAVRSAELVAALTPWFEIVEERRTGGALLHLALGDIAQNFDLDGEDDRARLLELFALEDRAMAEGEIGSDFAVLTAVPRQRSFGTTRKIFYVTSLAPALEEPTEPRPKLIRLSQEIERLSDELAAARGVAQPTLSPAAFTVPTPPSDDRFMARSGELYSFDEDWYCITYPDVVGAIKAGVFSDGKDHYIKFGQSEGRFPCARAAQEQQRWLSNNDDEVHAPADVERTEGTTVRFAFPPGHYYSPIVNPEELAKSGFAERQKGDSTPEIDIDYDKMHELIQTALAHKTPPMPEEDTGESRYFINNDMYGIGDAIVLSCFLSHFKPKRWIEVGSGFSSAVLLDTLEINSALDTDIIFIEPNTERLEHLLRKEDSSRVTIIPDYVQDVPLCTFDVLEAGDVLFLDTTHISKTGSDVNHELFLIIPRLKSGVIIHFHDIFHRFEYPETWIYRENRSWNEQYLLRAFLMFNKEFEVLYANDSFAKERASVLEAIRPEILKNPGGGLWLRRK